MELSALALRAPGVVSHGTSMCNHLPRPSSYPPLGPKYLLLGTIYPQLRVQGGSWCMGFGSFGSGFVMEGTEHLTASW